MNSPRPILPLSRTTKQIDQIVDAVLERGYDETHETIDDYGILMERFESRKLVTFQLYDSYFPPKRHEFDLELLSRLVDSIAANQIAIFVGVSVAGGVVGNAAYDILKHLLSHAIKKLKPIKRSHSCFKEIERNADQLMKFFDQRSQAGIMEICEAVDVDPDKIEPLLKLLGFRCRRKGKRRIWMVPLVQQSNRNKKR